MQQEDTFLFGFVDWLGRILLEKVDTVICPVFNLKSYVSMLCRQILCTLGAHLPKLLAAVQSFQLPALCKHMLQLTHSFRAWACAFTCIDLLLRVSYALSHLDSHLMQLYNAVQLTRRYLKRWNLFERWKLVSFTLNHWSHFPKLLLEFLETINPDTRWYDCAEGLRRVLEAVFEKSPAAEWQLGWKVRKGWSNFATTEA